MSDSILVTIKKLLGISEECDSFDTDLVIFINSAFLALNQLGVGPEEGYGITGPDETWNAFLDYTEKLTLYDTQNYIFLKTKLLFDASSLSSAYLEAINKMIAEYEWRMKLQGERKENEDES